MPRTHGYSKIGQRCFGTHDWGAKGRTNAIGALLGTSLLTLELFDYNINLSLEFISLILRDFSVSSQHFYLKKGLWTLLFDKNAGNLSEHSSDNKQNKLQTQVINTDAFSIWVQQDLLPKLPSESILVMDNASFHKSKSMQEKIQTAGHTLEYLPPYSPDLNPIEHKWAQAKSQRRKYQCGIDELFKEYCL